MPVNKPHLEFRRVDMNSGWSTPPGYPTGIEQKILAAAVGIGSSRRAISAKPERPSSRSL
jgi:hypothetical protein